MKVLNAFLKIARDIRSNKRWCFAFLWLSILLLIAMPEGIAWRDAGRYFHFFTSPFALVYLAVLFSILGVLYTLFNHYGLAWILTFVPVCLLAQINHMKYINNSKPLFPWDILIVWEGLKAANSMADPRKVVFLTLGVCLLCLLGAIVILFMLPKFSLKRLSNRVRLLILCAIILIGIGLSQRLGQPLCESADLAENYRHKGFLIAFLNHVTDLPKIHVEDYSQAAIDDIAKTLPKQIATPGTFEPDIIVLVSESYFDITKLPHITYSEPVNPFFQELKKQHSLKWYSPSFGGQTANAEFEMLTGFPLALFSPQVVPYRLYIRRKTESIASILHSAGYHSVFIHPYHKNFWSRNTVIPNLGFDEFIALEDMEYTTKRGGFVSDDSLVSEAIDVMERENGPVFLYLMTIQNHYPFEAGRYDTYDDAVKVNSDRLSDAENGMLESFANGILDSDRALRRLVEHVQKHSDRPTLVLFHGDHLPSLHGSSIYEKLGVDLDQNLSRHEVDGVMWSNYPIDITNNGGYQMCYMPMKVLGWAKQPMSVYFRFLQKLSQDYPILHTDGIYDSAGNKIAASDFYISKTAHQLRLLVYDLVFGKAYSTKIENDLEHEKTRMEF